MENIMLMNSIAIPPIKNPLVMGLGFIFQ
jgi:hypothetical protein